MAFTAGKFVARLLGFAFKRDYTYENGAFIPLAVGGLTSAGVRVSEETALRFATVWACVNAVSSDLAKLPITLTRLDGEAKYIASEHDQFYLLTQSPHKFMSAFTFWKAVGIFEELYGAAFVEIERNPETGRPVNYRLMATPYVTHVTQDGELYWRDHETGRLMHDSDVLRFMGWTTDGVHFKSPIQVHRETIGAGIAQNNMSNEFIANGLRTDGYIKTATTHTNKAQSDALAANFSNQLRTWEIPVLDGNSEFKQFGMPLTDAQFIENRKYNVVDVCRIWRMPPHKVGQMENAIKANIQEQNQEYIDDTLMPRIVNREQEVDRKVFRHSERSTHKFNIETRGLLRGDPKARADLYKVLFDSGLYTKDEIRAEMDKNPLPKGQYGDQTFTRLDTIPSNMIEKWHTAAQNSGNNE